MSGFCFKRMNTSGTEFVVYKSIYTHLHLMNVHRLTYVYIYRTIGALTNTVSHQILLCQHNRFGRSSGAHIWHLRESGYRR